MTRVIRQLWRATAAGCALLLAHPASPAAERDRILLIVGGPSHGYGEHEYRAGAEIVRDALRRAQGLEALRSGGSEVLGLVESLLEQPDEFVRLRAVWLLPYLGPAGIARTRVMLDADLAAYLSAGPDGV